MKTTQQSILRIGIFFLGLAVGQHAFAFSTGVTGYSGNPATSGGGTCSGCHSGGTVPTVTLTGPLDVVPGTINRYTLTISGGQANSGGLDVSVDSGNLINVQADTKLVPQSGEITHTSRKVATGGVVSWEFEWQAPATGGTPTTATIYSAGLSTNGNGGTTGDAVQAIVSSINVSASAPQPPTAIITAPQTAQVGQPVVFDGSSSYDPDGIINSYDWDFGDGSKANGMVTSHTYGTAGTFTVRLTVTDDTLRTHTTFKDITVGGVMIPVADPGGPYEGTVNEPVNFDGSLSSHTSPIVRYIWDFGDGIFAESAVPTISHTYTLDGTFTVTLAVQDSSGITGVGTTIASIVAVPLPPDGAALYTSNCAACHGPLESSSKLNKTATQIQAAIDANLGGMGAFSGLTPEEVQAIADALVSASPPPPVTDGPTLYANNCATCHGPLATSTKLNKTAAQIQAAIDAGTGGMSSLSGLTPTQIQAIADALVTASPPPPVTDGPTLYAQNCATCHGPLASSTKLNKTATQIQGAITANLGGMGALSSLTPTQIQAIADALVSTTPPPAPTSGEGLYNAYCLVCHGAEGRGGTYENVRGQSASSIAGAISSEPLMQSLSSLTSTQIQAIAQYLSGSAGPTPTPTTTGKALYDTYCLACHGTGGKGGLYEGVTGASTSKISSAIQEEQLMRSLSTLTTAQRQAISDYLNGKGGSAPAPAPTDGAGMYTSYCSGCHGPLSTSSKLGRTASQIQAAIDGNLGGMGSLASILTPTNIQAIADALSTGGGGGTGGGGTGGGGTLDGATLYTNNCSGCHGPLATSSKIGRSASQIQAAITAGTGGMGGLSSLTSAEIQAIADALASTSGGGGTTPTPTTGESLYISMCQGCHGVNGTGGSGGAIVGTSASNILSAISSVSAMSGLSLTSTQATDIANFLASGGGTTPEPTTGAELYAVKCQACHGAGGYGGTEEAVRGASLSEIKSAMQSVSVMQPIPLTDAQAQAIANYLNGQSYGGGDDD